MRKIYYLLIGLLFCGGLNTFGQNLQIINQNITVEEAVQDVLLGAGIEAFNVKYNGQSASAQQAQNGVKHFITDNGNFPMEEGVIMHSKGAPSVNNDPDLAAIGGNVTNGSIIEFDFIPTGDTLSFQYIFASMEYSSYTCSSYNDAFGFFISGPGINGPFSNNAVNIATIPGSNTPVAINTVNGGSPTGFGSASNCQSANPNWLDDSQYFTLDYNSIYNPSGSPFSDYNGSTVMLTANSDLVCGDTFHIKLAISNVSDQGLDSGVFLAAGSFESKGVEINIEANIETDIPGIDTVLVEGCTDGTIYFTRPGNQADDEQIVHFEVGGTATQGEDFPQLADGDSIVFNPGDDTVSITISPIQDGIVEGPESVIITAFTVNACGDTIYTEGTIWIVDEPQSFVVSSDTTVYCASDSIPIYAHTENGFAPYEYSWSNGAEGDSTFASISENGEHEIIVTSTDACGFERTDTSLVVMDQSLAIDTLIQGPTECGKNTGYVSGVGSGYTGTPHYTWTNSPDYPESGNHISASVWENLPSGWYYFTIEDDVCSVNDSVFVEQDDPPEASFDADPVSGGSPLNVTFTNNSDDADQYDWDFGNGESASVNDKSNQHSTYIDEGVYTITLTVTKGGCSDTDTKIVEVILPIEYDTPNVFTPNGDGINDYFTINAENAASIDLVILNRWGNVVYESNDVNFQWNGKVKGSGADCEDGVYFYKFDITDNSGKVFKEHGFVHLTRDK